MNDTKSIEFEDIKKDKSHQETVRQSFRVPVDPDGDMTVVINAKSYHVVDIGLEGIGIACGDNTAFKVGQTFDNCELKIPNDAITNLSGKVVHTLRRSGKGWQNGIKWIMFDEETSKKISALVASLKEKLMKETSSSD